MRKTVYIVRLGPGLTVWLSGMFISSRTDRSRQVMMWKEILCINT